MDKKQCMVVQASWPTDHLILAVIIAGAIIGWWLSRRRTRPIEQAALAALARVTEDQTVD